MLRLGGPPILPGTPRMARQMRDLFAYDQSIQHPGYSATPKSIHAAWREAENGNPRTQCDMIDDLIEVDAHARNLFEKREQAVAGKPSTIQAGGASSDEELAAAVLRFALGRLDMKPVYEHLLTYNRYGWGAAEIDWGILSLFGRDWIVPTWFTTVKANRFRIATAATQLTDPSAVIGELRLYTDITKPHGEPLAPGKWITLLRQGIDLARSGLGRTFAWNAMGKRYSYRDLLIFSQRYGMPMPIATYKTQGEHADEEAIDVAYQIVENIGKDGGAVVPDTVRLDFPSPVQGDNKVHPSIIALVNAENSKLINGSTLSNDNTNAGGASYALGEIHDGVRWEAVQYDAERLQSAMALQVFEPFMVWNGLAARGAATPRHNIQVARDLAPATRVAVADTLVNKLGVKVSISQLRSDTGFREPTSDDDAAPGAPVAAPSTKPVPEAA